MSCSYFVKLALLEDGWADNVLITVTPKGVIESVVANSENFQKAEHLTGVLIPGMPNLHSHAFQRAFAGLSEEAGSIEDSFWTWRKTLYQFVDKLNPDQVSVIARQLYIEMLKSGYTSVAEFHYLHHEQTGRQYSDPAEMSHRVINAALDTGISITHLPVYYRYSGFDNQPATETQRRFIHQPDQFQQLLESLYHYYAGDERVNIGIAPHSLRAVRADDINRAISILDAFDADAPIHIHIAEQMAEVIDCQNHTGQRPIEHLFDQCDVDQRWSLIHATHLNQQEVTRLAGSGAVVGLCLTTEANLGDGFFSAADYFQHQGLFGIGSDSHISVSPLEELRLLEYGQRLMHQKRAVLCDQKTTSVGRFLYQGALKGGARAVARNIGKIAVGYQADWLILAENNPAFFSKTNDKILDAMIFSSQTNPVKDVMVAGVWVVRDGHHQLEEESLMAFSRVLAEIIE